jgi:CheY-like chemotaxis protein
MTRRIIVIDDDDDVREITELSLSHFGGWEVTAVDNGTDGADCVATGAPDAVLLDVMMPPPDGEATARAIRERSPGTPIVLLTADAAPPAWATEVGIAGLLVKPFDPARLCADLTAVLRW